MKKFALVVLLLSSALPVFTQETPPVTAAQTHFERGEAFLDQKDLDNAILEFTEAIRLDPDYVDAYAYRGIAYDDKGNYDYAIADYTQAVQLNPNLALAYHYRGLTYQKREDTAKADADFAMARELGFTP
jgi:tetratricopeptide (TPR) repeat protein